MILICFTLLLHLSNVSSENKIYLSNYYNKKIADLRRGVVCAEEEKIPLNPCFQTALIRKTEQNQLKKQRKYTTLQIPKTIGHHFAVIGNVLYSLQSSRSQFGTSCGEDFSFVKPSRERRWLLQISRILLNVSVPDFEFTFYHNDVPPFRSIAIPGLSFSKLKNTNIVPFPFLKFAYSENLTKLSRDSTFDELGQENPTLKAYFERKDMLVWVGDVKPSSKFVSKTSGRLIIKDIAKKFPEHIYIPEERLSFIQQSEYKYILSLVGRGFTWYLSYALLTGSVVFIQENNAEQWFASKLVPYVHFIPVSNDLSNLVEQTEWARNNEQTLLQIAGAGRRFALEHLTPEAVERAARDSILLISKKYQNDVNIYKLARKSFVKACAVSIGVWKCSTACGNCPDCQIYDD